MAGLLPDYAASLAETRAGWWRQYLSLDRYVVTASGGGVSLVFPLADSHVNEMTLM
jgi:hypothetical protein